MKFYGYKEEYRFIRSENVQMKALIMPNHIFPDITYKNDKV
jgi:hypothetical protein